MKRILFTALAIMLAGGLSVHAKVTLAPVFSDNMVLQQDASPAERLEAGL